MDLITLREKIVKRSGRYDLVVDSDAWADNGIDSFIESGQNMIERMAGLVPEAEGRIWETITAGDYYVGFQQRCRSIISVWANNSEERFELTKIDWEDLKDYFADIASETDSDEPRWYCPAKLRGVDVTDKDATGTFLNYIQADSDDYRGILVLPPVDEAYDIEILGKFYHAVLTADGDTNFWSIIHPDVLIKATIYQIYSLYRSERRIRSLRDIVRDDVTEIIKDGVEEEIVGITQMEG